MSSIHFSIFSRLLRADFGLHPSSFAPYLCSHIYLYTCIYMLLKGTKNTQFVRIDMSYSKNQFILTWIDFPKKTSHQNTKVMIFCCFEKQVKVKEYIYSLTCITQADFGLRPSSFTTLIFNLYYLVNHGCVAEFADIFDIYDFHFELIYYSFLLVPCR